VAVLVAESQQTTSTLSVEAGLNTSKTMSPALEPGKRMVRLRMLRKGPTQAASSRSTSTTGSSWDPAPPLSFSHGGVVDNDDDEDDDDDAPAVKNKVRHDRMIKEKHCLFIRLSENTKGPS